MFPVTTHSKLSPSRLFRVLECPGSFRFAMPYDQDTAQSPAAAEGEFLHTVVEKCIKRSLVPEAVMATDKLDLTQEQLNALNDALVYFNNCNPHKPYLEAQVSLMGLDPVLYECGGTCDVHWIDGNQLNVLDWKFGRSEPIWAANNDQLMAYAWGIIELYKELTPASVKLHIVMPRLDHYDSAEYSMAEMNTWLHGRLIPGARAAYEENARFNPGEKQCRWCAAKNICRHRATKARQTASDVFAAALRLPDDITIDEVSDLLKDIPNLKRYIADLEKFAISQLLTGQSVPGFKLVAGRSNRKWKSEEEAEVYLSNRFEIDEIYESKLISPSKAEALDRSLKKDDAFKELFHKAQGSPTMVPEYDKRPALDVREASAIFADALCESQDEE
jgi:hypothetical protein